jgi:RNA polymerase II subunit A small phosphatase-like protein
MLASTSTLETAAYAGPVLDALDPQGKLFAARLFRGDTSRSPCGRRHVKDLSRLGRDPRRVLLVRRDSGWARV